MALSLIAAAAAPGCALLAYLYLKDRYESEPIKLVLRMFLCGALAVFPLMVLQRSFVLGFGDNTFLFSFVYSAGMEEAVKWLILYVLIYKHVEFDEPYDGIVYAAAVSLGYATVENIMYALVNYTTFSQIMIRALLPVSGHALFGIFMGYYLGKAKFQPGPARKTLAFSLLLPILYHGIFDFILTDYNSHTVWFIVPFMVLLWSWSLWKIKNANMASPLRVAVDEEFNLRA
ncbi:glutamic-type intramembrane protease PrsW [Gorillibacterium sp. sgz500922]|uniref:glutamic-type intramembrane protease PrsW n=1 Tax=Gorillibacterium sp. sgz500922 TaxID=3446694 RepID=UPI003F6708AF